MFSFSFLAKIRKKQEANFRGSVESIIVRAVLWLGSTWIFPRSARCKWSQRVRWAQGSASYFKRQDFPPDIFPIREARPRSSNMVVH